MAAARLLRKLFPTFFGARFTGIRLSPTPAIQNDGQRGFLPLIDTICVAGITGYVCLKWDRTRNANKLKEENDRLWAEYQGRRLKLKELRKVLWFDIDCVFTYQNHFVSFYKKFVILFTCVSIKIISSIFLPFLYRAPIKDVMGTMDDRQWRLSSTTLYCVLDQ